MKRRNVKKAYGQTVLVIDTNTDAYSYHYLGRNTKASRYLVNHFNELYKEYKEQ